MFYSGSYIDVRYSIEVDGQVFSSRSSVEITAEAVTSALESVTIVNTEVVYSVKVVLPDGTVQYVDADTLGEAFTELPVTSDLTQEYTEVFNSQTENMGW